MKLTVIFMLAACLQVSASAVSQQVTLKLTHVPLEKALKEISQQTGYEFFYRTEHIKLTNPVTVNMVNTDLKAALDLLFKDQLFTYAIANKTIIVSARPFIPAAPEEVLLALPPADLRGKVLGENGPLAGVTVLVKGTTRSVLTNEQGEFSLKYVNEDAVLVFSYVGFKKQEIPVHQNSFFSVTLVREVAHLDQVVIVGYGSARKKDLTGSIATVAAEDIENIPFNTIDNALAGKAAGVQVTKTDGSPGGAVRIRIRGSSSLLGGNEPLYVIDGVPVQVQSNFINPGYSTSNPIGNDVNSALAGAASNGGLSTAFVNGLNNLGGLNIDDIESISILKDASSTAIYGSKAANGVVIITTKRGKKDMPSQITARYSTIVSTPITPKLLNAGQYKMLLTEAAQNSYNEYIATNTTVPANVKAILNNPAGFFGNANTDWVKEVTRSTIAHNAELSVQGGGSKSRYFSSISYTSTPGVSMATSYQRISGKINMENEIRDHFRFNTNIILGYTNQDINTGAYGQALKARPDYTPFDSTGNFTDFTPVGSKYQGFQNPMALLTAINNSRTLSLIGSLSGIYDITTDLHFKSAVSLNMQTYNQRTYTPSYLEIGSVGGNVSSGGGIGSSANSRLANWFFENTLNYNKTFHNNHSLDVLSGVSYETRKTSFLRVTAAGYPNDNNLNGLSSASTPLSVAGDDPLKPQSYLVSFYLRANYGFREKYLFTFTGRSDGSSKFGADNKFGYFPSGAVAWRISKENFLKNVQWINDIKIRGSYGLTGNQNIGDQMYRTLYSPVSYAGGSALIPDQLGNNSIKWETTKEGDGGIDIAVWDSRIQATIDYYNKQTNGALLSLPVAPSSSYSSLLRNVAGIKNTGWEVSVQADIIRGKQFRWDASINITWNKSIVTSLSTEADLTQIGDRTGLEVGNTALIEGQPLGLLTGVTVKGLVRTKADLDAYKKRMGIYASRAPLLNIGDAIYMLNNENSATGSLTNYNTIIASAAPKYFGGFTQGFTYKQFRLQCYFAFSQGGKLVWGDHVSSVQFTGTSNANVAMLNRYNAGNTDSDQPRLLLNGARYYKSNLDVFSSSYIKLRTLTLNYQLGKSKWMEKAGIRNLSFFASANNIWTITKYPGLDPETSNDPYSVAGGYFDVSNYPATRSYSMGINASF